MICAFAFLATTARADDSGSDEFSGHLGYLLPNQIDGVTEILPVFGLRYAYPAAPAVSIEGGAENSHASGVDYTTLTLDLRGELEPMQHFLALFYGGVNFHWYAPVGKSDRQTDWGGNLGGGLMMKVTDTVWLRGDLRFDANPGTALYFGFGIAFRESAGGS